MPPEESEASELQAALSDLVAAVPGTLGAVLADWEGETVDRVARMDDYQLRIVGAHQGVILQHLREVIRRLGGDCLQEIAITTDQRLTLVLPVTEDYFLVVFMAREAPFGQALLAARRCLMRLRAEIV